MTLRKESFEEKKNVRKGKNAGSRILTLFQQRFPAFPPPHHTKINHLCQREFVVCKSFQFDLVQNIVFW